MNIRKEILPVLKPHGGQEEIDTLAEVIKSGWWGKGSKVDELEKSFAKLVGAKYALAVTSNTVAQDLILKAKGVKNMDFFRIFRNFPKNPPKKLEILTK